MSESPSGELHPVETVEDDRTGLSVDTLKRAFIENLVYHRGRHYAGASRNDFYLALAYTVRDRMAARWIDTVLKALKNSDKFVHYLSAEFLMGPQLGNNLVNLGLVEQVRQAMYEVGIDLEDLIGQEEEPGLGNGGLGRLAACYLDSLATLNIRSIGYGIRYEFGIFDQAIQDGWQVELTDKWLHWGNPWEIERPEKSYEVSFGGRTESYQDETGRFRVRWLPDRRVRGLPYDTMVLGYNGKSTSLLRLWKAEAVESFDFAAFNAGDYAGAVEAKIASENISKVLYPNDNVSQGRQLRLEQQYFFVSCSLQDILSRHLSWGGKLQNLAKHNAIQLNDTHPSIAVAELMRLLLDEHGMDWDSAWSLTEQTLAYTNHTLLPEALEKWPLPLIGSLLPRHLEIIYEINRRFLDQVRAKFPGDEGRVARMSIIDEHGERHVRMAHLAAVGSHAINGVAELHSELLRRDVLRDFNEMWPEKIRNVTNGVTPRRWLVLSNPALTSLISSKVGTEWPVRMELLRELEQYAGEAEFQAEWRRIKLDNKRQLARIIGEKTGIVVEPASMFDVQVKRIHEYKRQHLNLLHIMTLYLRLKRNPSLELTPRTFLFGGKAAPGYFIAKLIVKLVNSVAEVVNNDPEVAGRIKVVFLPDFNVTLAQRIYPAAELSEQISTAGKEASGTGNMKFAMNGSLTIGTLDGANIEIREEVGEDNFFLFGLTAEQVYALRASGYQPRAWYEGNPALREVLDSLISGRFSRGDRTLFTPLYDSLLSHDPFLLLADYQAYVDCQDHVAQVYRDEERWTRMSIMNTARTGKFSSDRSIRDYCRRIWGIHV